MIATHLHEAILKADRQNLPSFDAPATRYTLICGAIEEDFGRLLTEDEKAYIWRMVCPVSQQQQQKPVYAPDDGAGNAPLKPAFDLLAPEFMLEISTVLAKGSDLYGDGRGWEKGRRWGGEFAAAMRHCWHWWRGEENDPTSGCSHLAHAAVRLMMLFAMHRRGIGEDDR